MSANEECREPVGGGSCGLRSGHPGRCRWPEGSLTGDRFLDAVLASAVTFTIPKPLWLSANRPATNFGYRARIVRDLHQLAMAGATVQRLAPIVGQVAVDWTVRYPKGTRKDKGEASNAQPTCKALLDGLVPCWLEDDGPAFVVSETYRRGPNLDRPNDHEVLLTLTPQERP